MPIHRVQYRLNQTKKYDLVKIFFNVYFNTPIVYNENANNMRLKFVPNREFKIKVYCNLF